MERRTVYHCADGVRRTVITDSLDPSKFVVHTEQVLDEIFDGIQRDRENMRPGGDIKHAARVPIEIYEMMIRQGWGPDDEAKWLNSSEAEPFRIWQGRV
jgi:hypothetical protein